MVALGIVWFLSLILSHYLAGPVYRIEQCLKMLRNGDLVHRAQFRPYDELKSLATIYNEAVDALQSRIRSLQEALSRGHVEKARQITEEFKI
jgi:methyl-accepting chemotaxis protein